MPQISLLATTTFEELQWGFYDETIFFNYYLKQKVFKF